ncbi:MAG: D-alanyl-D-alanine carboxypeptidase [Oscillospiraceae bacterium]|nr:D-alanyl-D-alanine carboxypeptidase [Oscillospiraceae bacterium]
MKRLFALLVLTALFIPTAAAAPEVDVPCALLMEKETGTVLYERSSHERRPPASVTKIMTMLLIMEALDSGRMSKTDMVSVSAHAASMGGSQVFLEEGEQMSVHELLKCIAVASANDAAVAMAEHLAGSESGFVDKMNQRAAQLGMEDTHFSNCTGLPVDDHYTSAHDIALMSRQLMLAHPDIREYTTIWMDTIRDGAFGLSNTNRLIRFYSGATGLKTGYTDTALYCLSATAQREDMELIAVVMGAPSSDNRFQAAKTMLDYGFATHTLTTVHPDQALPPVEVLLGQTKQVQPRLARSCRLLLPRDSVGQVSTQIVLAQDVQAPVEQGQRLGEMIVLKDGQELDRVPIIADTPVPKLTWWGVFRQLYRRMLTTP